jgi:hypothetical protein
MTTNVDDEIRGEIARGAVSTESPTLPSQTCEHPAILVGTLKTIGRVNRNTTWIATGLLGSVLLATLILVLQGLHSKVGDHTAQLDQTSSNLLLNANPAAPSNMDLKAKGAGAIASGPGTSVDQGKPSKNDRPYKGLFGSKGSPRDDNAGSSIEGTQIKH